MTIDESIFKSKCIITIAVSLFLIALGLEVFKTYSYTSVVDIQYETFDIRKMAKTTIAVKQPSKKLLKSMVNTSKINGAVTEVALPSATVSAPTENPQPTITEPIAPVRVWYLPTEQGYITQYPSQGHAAAYDITSPRGVYETIYPVASGTISAIYTDNYGALVIAVSHDIGGQKITSLYAHLSSYAYGVYVGMPVDPYTPLGQMGTTGYSTGVHLHLVVVDCNFNDPNDYNCSNLNNFFNYTSVRYSQGLQGLGSYMDIPYSWYTR